ncbi:hypothetical protein BDR07DRAFT_1520696 [Suillus spraguei]|nr:hypothetical protein BDR07DRAFT_1520696 [Suillus spraguei]
MQLPYPHTSKGDKQNLMVLDPPTKKEAPRKATSISVKPWTWIFSSICFTNEGLIHEVKIKKETLFSNLDRMVIKGPYLSINAAIVMDGLINDTTQSAFKSQYVELESFTGDTDGSAPKIFKWDGKVGEEGSSSLIYDYSKPEQVLLQHQDKLQYGGQAGHC